MFDIIKKSYLWIAIAIIGIWAGFLLFFSNLRLSIDFTGGLEMKIQNVDIDKSALQSEISSLLDSFEHKSTVEKDGKSKEVVKKLQSYKVSIDIDNQEWYSNILINN